VFGVRVRARDADVTFAPATYSKRTICPYCNARIRLEDVRFTPTFQCPQCEQYIKVSDAYQRAMRVFSWVAGLLIPYAFGVRFWLWLLVLWLPCVFVLIFLWAYVGKYLVPPRLEKV
jgi:uncharacterized paraquat-inducible protein A